MSTLEPIRCKAAVAREIGKPLVMEEVIVAPPKAHEVRIKIICTALCHTDITLWTAPKPIGFFPRILGHEAVGIVESIGEGVEEYSKGDYVMPTFMAQCGECEDCNSRKSNLCSKLPFKLSPCMPRDETTRFTDVDGNVLYHSLFVSSFAQYTVVDVAHITKLDPTMPPHRACLLSCGVSTGVGAAWKAAKVKPGSKVAIFGLGAVGLAVAQGARLCGATMIIGVDVNPEKLEIGKKFGVTNFINSSTTGIESVSKIINEMTNGGADCCFECVGLASLVEVAYASCRKGWGKTIMLGGDKYNSPLGLKSLHVLESGIVLKGSLFGGLKVKTDIDTLVKWYMDKKLKLDDFVTHEMKFDDINEAFKLLLEGKSIRCVLWMDDNKRKTFSP